jgi:hypothetical protein
MLDGDTKTMDFRVPVPSEGKQSARSRAGYRYHRGTLKNIILKGKSLFLKREKGR